MYKWRELNAMVYLHKAMFKAETGINIKQIISNILPA